MIYWVKIFTILSLILPGKLWAKDFDQQFATYGPGAESCRSYTTARDRGGAVERSYIDWTIGYLSAFNLIVDDTYDILGKTDFTTVLEWLDNRCRNVPDEHFVNTVAKLTEILYSDRHRYRPDQTSAPQR